MKRKEFENEVALMVAGKISRVVAILSDQCEQTKSPARIEIWREPGEVTTLNDTARGWKQTVFGATLNSITKVLNEEEALGQVEYQRLLAVGETFSAILDSDSKLATSEFVITAIEPARYPHITVAGIEHPISDNVRATLTRTWRPEGKEETGKTQTTEVQFDANRYNPNDGTVTMQTGTYRRTEPQLILTREQMEMAFDARTIAIDAEMNRCTPEEIIREAWQDYNEKITTEILAWHVGNETLASWRFTIGDQTTNYPGSLENNQIVVSSGYIATSPAWRIVTFVPKV